MTLRSAVAALLAGALLLGASACTGADPAATPTATGFATEEEAYAAAEQTYRAYIDALNAVDLSDPNTFEPALALTTGTLNAEDRKNFSTWHADGWIVTGGSKVTLVQPGTTPQPDDDIQLSVCLDVSGVVVVDAQGASVVSSDRGAIQALTASLTMSDKSTWLVAEMAGRDGQPAC